MRHVRILALRIPQYRVLYIIEYELSRDCFLDRCNRKLLSTQCNRLAVSSPLRAKIQQLVTCTRLAAKGPVVPQRVGAGESRHNRPRSVYSGPRQALEVVLARRCESRSGSIECSGTLSLCEGRWRPGGNLSSPTSSPRSSSTRRSSKASWKCPSTWLDASTTSTSSSFQRFQAPDRVEPIERLHIGFQRTGANSAVQGDCEARQFPGEPHQGKLLSDRVGGRELLARNTLHLKASGCLSVRG